MTAPILPGSLWAALTTPQRVEIVQADAGHVWYETLVTRRGREPQHASFTVVGRAEFERRYRAEGGNPEPPAGSVAATGGSGKFACTGRVQGPPLIAMERK